MSTPWHHAVSTAKKWGGNPEDYIKVHDWFDETKSFTGDWTHRALRHHSAGIQWAVEKFGYAVRNSKGQMIPIKLIAEQHVLEDCGYIPTPQSWLKVLAGHPEKWMLQVGKTTTTTPLKVV